VKKHTTTSTSRRFRGDGSVAHTPRGRRLSGQDGYIAAMTALLLLPLMAFTAMAVDAGSWYAQGAEQQRTADAAALAGVVYMPDVSRATSTALEVTSKNGYDATTNAVVTVTPVAANRLRVTIQSAGEVYFSPAVGKDDMSITRSATAEFLVTIPMGSPLNFSGIDPEIANATGGTGNNPSFWNNSAGRTTSKVSGDRFTAGNGAGVFQGSCASPITNCDFDDQGYVFLNKVESVSGPLNIQVYDPAAVDVGDYCNGGNSSGGGDKLMQVNNGPPSETTRIATQFATAGISATPSGSPLNVALRWGRIGQQPNAAAQAQARRYCNGDWIQGWNTAVGAVNPRTTWIVRAPDGTPLDNLDNPPICAITFDSYSGPVFNRISSTTNPLWNTSGAAQTATEKVPFWHHFRNWFTICNVSTPVVGNYVIQVRNNANTTNLGSTPQTNATPGLNIGTLGGLGATTAGDLHNRYSIRAGWAGATPQAAPPSSTWSQGLSVYAESKFPIYTNQGNQLTTFYLSRITPEYAGSRIRLNLWDIGDGANVNLSIRPPTESPTAFTGCTWQRDNAAFAFNIGAGCSVTGLTSGNFNGRLTSATLNIDTAYTCNVADPLGCWFLIDITPTSGNPNDTTTWSADVLGNPLHLIE